jgi:hypothetical protein
MIKKGSVNYRCLIFKVIVLNIEKNIEETIELTNIYFYFDNFNKIIIKTSSWD